MWHTVAQRFPCIVFCRVASITSEMKTWLLNGVTASTSFQTVICKQTLKIASNHYYVYVYSYAIYEQIMEIWFSCQGADQLTAGVVVVQRASIMTHAAGGAICHTGSTVWDGTDWKRKSKVEVKVKVKVSILWIIKCVSRVDFISSRFTVTSLINCSASDFQP